MKHMKNFATKKNVLIASGIVTLFLASLFILGSDSCYSSPRCHGISKSNVFAIFNDDNLLAAFVFPPLFLLSLLTYRMQDEVFRAWWNFARWLVPIIVLVTVLVNLMPSNRGFFNMDALVYLLVLAPLYAILILVSLWKIVSKYRELKHEGK